MEIRLTPEKMEALAQPFPAEAIQWKPGAVAKNQARALALAYVDSRYYQDRLNEVVGPGWSDDHAVQLMGQKVVVVCTLNLCGVIRTDVGECDLSDQNAATTAKAQAFKRACTAFGLGAYLYRLPRLWVEYDAQRKSFPDEALARLQRLIVESDSSTSSVEADRYGDGTPLNGNQAERDAYLAYITAEGKRPENVAVLRRWYAAKG